MLSFLCRSSLLFCLLVSFISQASGDVVSKNHTMVKPSGEIRYHFDDGLVDDRHSHVLMIGVGTAMSVTDYDLISAKIIQSTPSAVVMILDANPGNFVKLSSDQFARLVERTKKVLQELVPSLDENAPIIISGHSASGAAAIGSLSLLSFTPAGYFGFDPFAVLNLWFSATLPIPSMIWGFSQTTCGVLVPFAAKGAYQKANETHRVMYQVQNTDGMNHCSFTDRGCLVACPSSRNDDSMRTLVGQSFALFLNALREGSFERNKFFLDSSDIKVNMLVNSDSFAPSGKLSDANLLMA